jgi:hypothetical protein
MTARQFPHPNCQRGSVLICQSGSPTYRLEMVSQWIPARLRKWRAALSLSSIWMTWPLAPQKHAEKGRTERKKWDSQIVGIFLPVPGQEHG